MLDFKDKIEKVCIFVFNFLDLDTAFVDSTLQKQLEFGHHQIPETLSTYLGDFLTLLNLNDKENTYHVTFHSNTYGIHFISAKVYAEEKYIGSIVLGPYLLEEPTILMIEALIVENNLSLSLKNIMKQYYLSLPLLSLYKVKIIAEFLAYITSNLHTISDQSENIGSIAYHSQSKSTNHPHILKKDAELYKALVEKRYERENKILHAVETGNIELLHRLLKEESLLFIPPSDRIPNDPLRSRKNLSFVLNTLLRKAAEKGGLHLLYIDSMSEKFAIQIEKTNSIQGIIDLNNQMFIDYCHAVKKYSLKNYSPLIRKTIEFIQIHISHKLSLEIISHELFISPSELSRQFKKETGKTITEYITKQRINESLYLLENKNLSITDIAHSVGFNDINYFTKVFRKLKGITPSEFRKTNF